MAHRSTAHRCLFCNRSLGKNHILPEQPIGKRLAFDPANTRLWTVCPSCERWSLTPLDDPERRSAIVTLEQFYAAETRQGAADDIGLAELEDGTTLIRVGATSWSRFAAWRYSRKLSARRKAWLLFAAIALGTLVFQLTPFAAGIIESALGSLAIILISLSVGIAIRRGVTVPIPAKKGNPISIRRGQLWHVQINSTPNGWQLLLPHGNDVAVLEGKDAVRALSSILPRINSRGAKPEELSEAIAMIEQAGGPHRLFARLAPAWTGESNHRLATLPYPFLLALEMAANEESETRALRGELAILSHEEKSASGIATIAEQLA